MIADVTHGRAACANGKRPSAHAKAAITRGGQCACDNALNDLQQAVSISDALRRHARAEEMFVPLRDLERFQELVGRPEDDPEIAL